MKKGLVIAIIALLALLTAFFGYRSRQATTERDLAIQHAAAAQAEAEQSKEEAKKQTAARVEAEQREEEAGKKAAAEVEAANLAQDKARHEAEEAQQKLAEYLKTRITLDDAGHFVATFPGEIQRGSQDVDTKVGKVVMHTVYHDGGAIAYMVIFSDYPAGSVTQSGGPEKVCQNASDGALQSENAKLQTSSPCQLGDITGLDVTADIPPKASDSSASNTSFHGRFFVVGDRLYQVMYISPPDKGASPEAEAFFDSFHLIR